MSNQNVFQLIVITDLEILESLDKGKAIVDGMEQILRTGDVITIAAGCKHTVEAITALDMIEVQLGDEISTSDKIKYELN